MLIPLKKANIEKQNPSKKAIFFESLSLQPVNRRKRSVVEQKGID